MIDAEKLIFAAAFVSYYDVDGDFGTTVEAVKKAVKMIDSLRGVPTNELSEHQANVLAWFLDESA